MKNPIVHFEIPADDVERANKFYTDVFDWRIETMPMPEDGSTGGEPYHMVFTTEVGDDQMPKTPGAINGGMMKRANPGQSVCNYVAVESIDDTLEQIRAHGGEVVMGKTEIGAGMGAFAVFMDTEGNQMGLYQFGEHEGGA